MKGRIIFEKQGGTQKECNFSEGRNQVYLKESRIQRPTEQFHVLYLFRNVLLCDSFNISIILVSLQVGLHIFYVFYALVQYFTLLNLNWYLELVLIFWVKLNLTSTAQHCSVQYWKIFFSVNSTNELILCNGQLGNNVF